MYCTLQWHKSRLDEKTTGPVATSQIIFFYSYPIVLLEFTFNGIHIKNFIHDNGLYSGLPH